MKKILVFLENMQMLVDCTEAEALGAKIEVVLVLVTAEMEAAEVA